MGCSAFIRAGRIKMAFSRKKSVFAVSDFRVPYGKALSKRLEQDFVGFKILSRPEVAVRGNGVTYL